MSKPFIESLSPPHGLELSTAMLSGIETHYSTPKRHYHNVKHVLELMNHFHRVEEEGPGWRRPKEVYCAILYHDIVYEFGATDNEEQSAVLAMKELPFWLPSTALDIDWIGRLIRLTAKHGRLVREEISAEEALFLDCDMAIMADSWARFQRYENEIEAEYASLYSKEMYQMGRRRFLSGIQAKPRIFLSDFFHQIFEAKARENLNRALAKSP